MIFSKCIRFIFVLLISEVFSKGSFVARECKKDLECSHCPEESLRRGDGGQILCCQDCERPPFKSKESNECACLEEENKISTPDFQRSPPKVDSSSYTDGYQKKKYGSSYKKKPTERESDPNNRSTLKQAVSLMAEAVEKIDIRMRMIEEVLGQVNLLKHGDGTVPDSNRTRKAPVVPDSGHKCLPKFTRVGYKCVYSSSLENRKGNWKEALNACRSMGASLAETLSGKDFLALASFLTENSRYKGYSHWVGGLYPGAIWVWLSNGKEVTKNPTYWTKLRLRGGLPMHQTVSPGDISNGRCLALHFDLNSESYRFGGDECGFQKFFLCETSPNLQYL